MRPRRPFGLALILGLTMLTTSVNGQYPISGNPGDWILRGDYRWRSGYPQEAVYYYNQAYVLASQAIDPYGMLNLAARYLVLRNEQAAVNSYNNSVSYAQHWMNADPGRGQYYAYGLNALQSLVNYYNNTIRHVAPNASQPTQEWFRTHTVAASNTVAAAMAQPPRVAQPQPPAQPQPQRSAPPTDECDRTIPNWCDINRVPYNYRTPNVK